MTWFNDCEKMENNKHKSTRRRVESSKNRAKYIEMEDQLDEWIKEQRKNGSVLCSIAIIVKAGIHVLNINQDIVIF